MDPEPGRAPTAPGPCPRIHARACSCTRPGSSGCRAFSVHDPLWFASATRTECLLKAVEVDLQGLDGLPSLLDVDRCDGGDGRVADVRRHRHAGGSSGSLDRAQLATTEPHG